MRSSYPLIKKYPKVPLNINAVMLSYNNYQSIPQSPQQESEPITKSDFTLEIEQSSLDSVDTSVEIIVPTLSTCTSSKSEIISLISILFCTFIADTTRGILFPTLWLNVQQHGGSKSSQGLAVAAFSFGRIIASPIFGYWCEFYGFRSVLISCNILIFVGCISYGHASSIEALILSQLIIGFGSGSLGVTRSYVAEKTNPNKRTVYLAYLTAVQYAGFTVMPLLGSYLSYIGSKQNNMKIFDYFEINRFTLPAYIMSTLSLLCIVCILSLFTDVLRFNSPTSLLAAICPTTETFTHISCTFTLLDKMAIGLCILNIATKGSIGVFETIGSEYVINHYQWTSSHIGIVFSFCGACGVILLLLFDIITRNFRDIQLVIYGMILMIISCLLIYFTFNFTYSQEIFYLSLFLMYGIGYPVGHTALLGMFSKIKHSGAQGKLMGWFAAMGSFAR